MSNRRHKLFTWPPLLCLLMSLAAWGCGSFSQELPDRYLLWSLAHADLAEMFGYEGVDRLVLFTSLFACLTATLMLLTAGIGIFFRNRTTLSLYRKACLLFYALALLCGSVAYQATGVIMTKGMSLNGKKLVQYDVVMLRWDLLWPVLLASAAIACLYLLVWRRAAIRQWLGNDETEPAAGDRFLENMRTHGSDPCYRKSLWTSFNFHFFIIFILPWLLGIIGCVTPYRIRKGSGDPAVAAKVVVVKVKKKPIKRPIINKFSPILFDFPKIDDSKVAEEVEKQSQAVYTTNASRVHSKGGVMGAGGGKTGGWPDGMDEGLVRFIRMKYSGSGWDDGMDSKSRADLNFLDFFRSLTGFKTSTKTEAHGIALLARYPPGFAPPFVYMTGDGGISVSAREIRIMREYLQGGGMLFADCGSPGWNGSFRNFIQQVFPGEPLLNIADDDMLFQVPFSFANGAPPLWHHGGNRALGIKYKGRWAVFYHPGDINDAWKNNRGGLSAMKADGALEMGVNIVYYSFTNYLELTRKLRKK
jgi:hypothetical protein